MVDVGRFHQSTRIINSARESDYMIIRQFFVERMWDVAFAQALDFLRWRLHVIMEARKVWTLVALVSLE